MPKIESQNVILIIDNSWMEAFLQIKNFLDSKAIVAELTEILKKNQIMSVNKAAVKLAISEKNPQKKYLICKGIKPEPGKEESYKLLVDVSAKAKPKVHEDGSVDLKELVIPNLVEVGQPVVEIIPKNAGKRGRNIKGESVEPAIQKFSGNRPEMEHFIPDTAKPEILLANKTGIVRIEDKKIVISENLLIRGNVDFSTGNVKFPGNVRIAGDVKSGFEVHVKGNVEIFGTVEDAILEIGGDLKIKNGFSGNGKGEIRCNGTVNLGYAINQNIHCKNLIFHKEIVNCKVYARENVQSEFGKIIGGKIEANQTISVHQIGNEESTSCDLILGSGVELIARKAELEEKIKEFNEKMVSLKDELYELFKKQIKKQLNESEEEKLNELKNLKDSIPENLKIMEKELETVSAAYEKIKKAQLIVRGTIYDGTKIEILGKKTVLRQPKKRIKFLFFNDEIKAIKV